MKNRTAIFICIILFMFTPISEIFSQKLVSSYEGYTGLSKTSSFGDQVFCNSDLNGDGYDDIVISAPDSDGLGEVFIIWGGTLVKENYDLKILPDKKYGDFATQLSPESDLNGDGFCDLVVGVNCKQNPDSATYLSVYLGGPDMDNIEDLRIDLNPDRNKSYRKIRGGGDINNDGYDDLLISETDDTSTVAVYFGGSHFSSQPAYEFKGYLSYNHDFKIINDMNGDGYDEIIMANETGSWSYSVVTLIRGGQTLSESNNVKYFISDSYSFGEVLSSAGDMNNDGFGDLIIGAVNRGFSEGAVYLYLGAEQFDNVADVTFSGEYDFGYTISGNGDINSDGYDDIAIVSGQGIPDDIYFYYGSDNINTTVDLVLPEIDNQYAESTFLGEFGDINGDGFSDFIYANKQFSFSGGQVRLVYGDTVPDINNTFNMFGEVKNSGFGKIVLGIGDYNKDGFDDVLMSSEGSSSEGHIFISFGSANPGNICNAHVEYHSERMGPLRMAAAGDINGDGYDDFMIRKRVSDVEKVSIYYGNSEQDFIEDVAISGGHIYYFGKELSCAGDVNNDGFDDILVGEYFLEGQKLKYAVRLYFGNSDFDSENYIYLNLPFNEFGGEVRFTDVGDINGDGFDDILLVQKNSEGATRQVAYVYFGSSAMDGIQDKWNTFEVSDFGYLLDLSAAGDVNNDGIDDFMISGYKDDVGTVFIYFGSNNVDIETDITLSMPGNERFGAAISDADDLNNDGFDDIIVGSDFDTYETSNGSVFIYYGSETFNNIHNQVIEQERFRSRFASSLDNVGDFNNDGFSDIIIGAPNYNGNGKAYIYSDQSAPVSVEQHENLIPDELSLSQNYPNPFNPTTKIEFSVPDAGMVKLTVFNILGEKVAELVNKELGKGIYSVDFNGSNLSSGLYIYTISTQQGSISKKMMLLK